MALKIYKERNTRMKYPKKIEQGKYIGITAPSGGITKEVDQPRLDNAIKNIEDMGYKVIETQNVRTEEKGRSSSAKERTEQFMQLWENEDVRAIISAGGGDYLTEMLDYIDWEDLKKYEPKWFQGYSDNTVLTFLIPRKIKIAPPNNSALFSYLSPKTFPTLVPIMDNTNVIIPINVIAKIKFTFKNANVIPTANASILVAIANTIIVLNPTLSLQFSLLSSLKASFIMFPPIILNKINATQ